MMTSTHGHHIYDARQPRMTAAAFALSFLFGVTVGVIAARPTVRARVEMAPVVIEVYRVLP